MRKVREAGVDVMTLGQYMRPTKRHMPVSEYITPEAFEEYRKIGLEMVSLSPTLFFSSSNPVFLFLLLSMCPPLS
jgi:lipoic acid synthetase